MAINAGALLAAPDDQAVTLGQIVNGGVGDGRARPEHQQRQTGGGNGDGLPLGDIGDRGLVLFDVALFEEEEAEAVGEAGEFWRSFMMRPSPS